jgi:hypothetical protein
VYPPFPYLTLHIYISLQCAAGGGAYLFQQWPLAYSGIFKATFRREGLVSLRTLQSSDGVGSGWFTTDPIFLPLLNDVCPSARGYSLAVNSHSSVSGSIAVGFYTTNTHVGGGRFAVEVPGWGLSSAVATQGNGIRLALQWNYTYGITSDISPLGGQTLLLNVSMVRTQLYAWQLQCIP